MGATVLWYRLLLAALAVVWLIVLLFFQYRLMDGLGRREKEALPMPSSMPPTPARPPRRLERKVTFCRLRWNMVGGLVGSSQTHRPARMFNRHSGHSRHSWRRRRTHAWIDRLP